MKNEIWYATLVKSGISVEVMGQSISPDPAGFSDGCVGFIPVFDTKENCEKYISGSGYDIDIFEIKKIVRAS